MVIKLERSKSKKPDLTFGDLAVGDFFTFAELGVEYQNYVFMKMNGHDGYPNCVSIIHNKLGSGNRTTEPPCTKIILYANVTLTINE